MSASREKKQRKLQTAASEELNAKNKDEKSSTAKYKIATIVVVIALVLSVALFVYQGFVTPNLAALTIGGEKVYDHELNYYYINSYSSFMNSVGDYASSIFGLNSRVPLSSQTYYADPSMTWHDYFLGQAKDAAQQIHMLASTAEKEGVTLNETYEGLVQQEMDSMKDYVETNGYDLDAYLKAMYGNRMTAAEYERLVRRGFLASQYSAEKLENFRNAITDEEMEEYYNDNRDSFDIVTYRRYLVNANLEEEMTEDETTAALETARATAERMANASTNEAEFIAQVVAYQNELAQRLIAEQGPDENGNLPVAVEYTSADAEEATLRSNITYSGSGAEGEWLFSADRSAGDVTTIDSSNGTYVVFFMNRTRNNYNTVDIRHILVAFEAFDEDGNPVEDVNITGDADVTDAQFEASETEAARILEEWKNGAATEESFAELAKKYSNDGNAADGGIYERVYKGQMVTAFEDWCFDSNRKPGDTGIVETEFGNHVMYYVGQDIPYWKMQALNAKSNAQYSEWQTAELENYPVVEKGGINNVGLN